MNVLRRAALAGVSIISLATPAMAQKVPVATDDMHVGSSENEIIVSARRREESIQDVPQTLNVVTAAQVDKLNLRNFTDIQAVVPGLSLTRNSSFDSSATVRGISFSPTASGSNPSVEFYLNDAPISSNFMFQSLFDVGQFELQRGPQGTLRGRASPSGAFTFTTRRPNLEQAGVVMNGTMTDTHSYKLEGAFNIPLIESVLGLRIAGVVDDSQGNRVFTIKQQTDPVHNPDPGRNITAIRASVRLEPIDWISANVMFQRLESRNRNYRQVVSAGLVNGTTPVAPVITPRDRLSIDDQGAADYQLHTVVTGNLDVRFAGQKLSYVGSYNEQDFAVFAQQDFGDFFAPPRFASVSRTFADRPGTQPVCQEQSVRARMMPTTSNYYQCTHGTSSRNSHELRLTSEERIGGIFDYVVGGFYDHNKSPSYLTSETPILANLSTVNIINLASILRGSETTEKSVFGNLTAHLGKFELSGGLRYIDYKAFASLIQNGVRPVPDTNDHENATIYSASAKYQVNPDLMVYASTGTSWRIGMRAAGNFSTTRTARETFFMDLPPETSQSYEVGAKFTFLDGRGRFNISAYHQDFKNYPYRTGSIFFINRTAGAPIDNVAAFNFLAAVPVKVDGVEAEASFQIADRWSISANASYANGRIKNGTTACNDLNRDGRPDINATTPSLAQLQSAVGPGEHVSQCTGLNQTASFTPRFSANMQTEYSVALSKRSDAFVRGLATIYGSNAADPTTGFDDTGAYALLNLYTGIRDPDGAWELTIFGKNITNNRKVLPSGNTASGNPPTGTLLSNSLRVGASTATYVSNYYEIGMAPPREFGLNLRIAFGSR